MIGLSRLKKNKVLLILSTVLVVSGVVLALQLLSKEDSTGTQPEVKPVLSETQQPTSDTPEARETDVSALLTGIIEFQKINKNKIPLSWTPEKTLMGVDSKPVKVSLSYYQSVVVKTGTQEPLKEDSRNIIMVIQSNCGTGGATTESFTGAVSVQYMVASQPKCLSTQQ